jgi:hypothetical protein
MAYLFQHISNTLNHQNQKYILLWLTGGFIFVCLMLFADKTLESRSFEILQLNAVELLCVPLYELIWLRYNAWMELEFATL